MRGRKKLQRQHSDKCVRTFVIRITHTAPGSNARAFCTCVTPGAKEGSQVRTLAGCRSTHRYTNPVTQQVQRHSPLAHEVSSVWTGSGAAAGSAACSAHVWHHSCPRERWKNVPLSLTPSLPHTCRACVPAGVGLQPPAPGLSGEDAAPPASTKCKKSPALLLPSRSFRGWPPHQQLHLQLAAHHCRGAVHPPLPASWGGSGGASAVGSRAGQTLPRCTRWCPGL